MKVPAPIVAGCVALAAFVFAAPKSASATPAGPAVHYGETHAGMVQEVGRRYRRGRYVVPYYGYGYGYGYRPYGYGYGYRPYGYGYGYRPYGYYRPYAYYGGYGYRYWRPGISFGYGF